MKRIYKISGMSCAACQARIEKCVSNIDGVSDISVNLIANVLTCNITSINLDDAIIKSVLKEGYGITLYDRSYKKVVDNKKIKLLVSIILLFIMAFFSMTHLLKELYIGIIEFILLIPIIILNFNYYTSGIKKLFKLHPNMDSLVSISTIASTVYGIIVLINLLIGTINNDPELLLKYQNSLYLLSSAMILTFVSIGKYVESYSKNKSFDALNELYKLDDIKYKVLRDDKIYELLPSDIKINDIVFIGIDQKIPTDGTIIKGFGYLNESMLTGESNPIYKKENDKVISGSINTNNEFSYKSCSTIYDSSLAKLYERIESSSLSKPTLANLTDKISYYFVPVVILISLITFLIWLFIKDFETALNFALSVLVISCPCALGLASPITIMISTAMFAKNKIITNNAKSIEKLSKVDTIFFDKTGTLTNNVLNVISETIYDQSFKKIIKAIELKSSHPLAKTIIDYYSDIDTYDINITSINNIPGSGIIATILNENYYLGSYEFINSKLNLKKDLDKNGIYLANSNNLLGYIIIKDRIKENAYKLISKLHKINKKTILLTGDCEENASYLKDYLGLDEVYYSLKPQDKAKIINDYKENNHKIAMIGDGLNDTISMQLADVSISLGNSSTVMSIADMNLITNDIMKIYYAINLANKTFKTIKRSLLLALIYNVIAIPIAAGLFAFVNIKINPMISAICMSLSSISVVINSIMLLTYKNKEDNMKTIIKVEGMMCKHCAERVKKDAMIDNVNDVIINLDTKEVTIIHEDADLNKIKENIIKDGYKVVE